VIRHLPQQHHIRVEQGLLKTFGRVMPVLMTLSVILAVFYAISLFKFFHRPASEHKDVKGEFF
jgi:hypothetical protein